MVGSIPQLSRKKYKRNNPHVDDFLARLLHHALSLHEVAELRQELPDVRRKLRDVHGVLRYHACNERTIEIKTPRKCLAESFSFVSAVHIAQMETTRLDLNKGL